MKKYFYILVFLVIGCKAKNENSNSLKYRYDTVKYNENRYDVYTILGNKEHGVTTLYDSKLGILEEKLFIQNKLLILNRMGGDSLHIGFYYYYNRNDSLIPIGSLIYDNRTLKKKQILCTYFEVHAKDSIQFGQAYKVKIVGNIGTIKDFQLSLDLGEIDTTFSLTKKIRSYHSNTKELEFTITNYNVGINLITGILHYIRDGKDISYEYRTKKIEHPYIFFKEFVVLPR